MTQVPKYSCDRRIGFVNLKLHFLEPDIRRAMHNLKSCGLVKSQFSDESFRETLHTAYDRYSKDPHLQYERAPLKAHFACEAWGFKASGLGRAAHSLKAGRWI